MTAPTFFEAIIFLYSCNVANSSFKPSDCRIGWVQNTENLISICIQLVSKLCRLLFEKAGLHHLSNATALYMLCGEFQARLLVR